MQTQILCGNGKTFEVVTSSDGRYNACYAELGNNGLTAEDMAMKKLAQARLLAGDANDLWQRGSWTSNGLVYVPNGDMLVTAPKYTPFLKNLDKAVAEHIAGRENYVNDEFQELMDNAKANAADAVKSGVLLLKRQGPMQPLPVGSFGDMPVTYFLFEELASQYGSALASKGITAVPLRVESEEYARRQNRPFSRALWADNLFNDSALDGGDNLGYDHGALGRVSGVRELSVAKRAVASGASQGAKSSTGNAGRVALTLEKLITLTRRFPDDISRKQLEAELEIAHRRQ